MTKHQALNSEPSKRRRNSTKWTVEENERLLQAYKKYNGKHWRLIAHCVGGGKTADQCNQRWHRTLNPEIKKTPWSEEEDETLLERVSNFGLSAWKRISQGLPGRTDLQCRHRYKSLHKVIPSTKEDSFSEIDEPQSSVQDSTSQTHFSTNMVNIFDETSQNSEKSEDAPSSSLSHCFCSSQKVDSVGESLCQPNTSFLQWSPYSPTYLNSTYNSDVGVTSHNYPSLSCTSVPSILSLGSLFHPTGFPSFTPSISNQNYSELDFSSCPALSRNPNVLKQLYQHFQNLSSSREQPSNNLSPEFKLELGEDFKP